MSKYLKLFETTSDYEAYINGEGVVLPNVSVAKDAPKTVYFNPIPPFFAKLSLNNGNLVELQGSGELTSAMVSPYNSSVVSAEIGELCTSIGSFAFSGCEGLTSITIPDSVTSIGIFAFQSCSGLTNVTIPNSVTSIDYGVFNGCSGLTSIIIPDSVTSIDVYAFSGCTGLTSIVVDSGNTVYDSRDNCNAIINTSTNELKKGCNNTVIPNTVTSIGTNAFSGCTGITSIIIPDSVTSIGTNAFSGCTGLTSIVVNSANTVFDSRDNCNAIIKTSTNELVVGCKNTVIPNTVTSIGDRVFQGCSSLTSITIGSGVTSIGDRAFEGCSGLTSVTIPSGVTSIGEYAFRRCEGLTSVTIGSGVTSIGEYAFSYCSGLTTITSLAAKAPTIQSSTFSDVKTGGTLTVPRGSTDYGVWMWSSRYYLGYYDWTKVEQ